MESTDYRKYKFDEVFKENSDGSLTPVRSIQVHQTVFGPSASFRKGVAFGGINFHLYKNRDIAAEEKNGTLKIVGFFKDMVGDSYYARSAT
jgi:hypothetical protein